MSGSYKSFKTSYQQNLFGNDVEGYETPIPGNYPINELPIRDERRTLQDVVRRIQKGRFVLDPDFQRGFVWDQTKQSRLIESILMRIPLPVFYVAEDKEGKFIVVDGRQRLTTFFRFFSGQLLLDLPHRDELNKKSIDDLDLRLRDRLEDCQLHFYIIEKSVPERAQLDIFERVNGGEILSRQQMRNALHNGPATQFLREEASTKLFKETTGESLSVSKMQDREFVNRFCSFMLIPIDEYKGDMDDWLASGLNILAKLDENQVGNLRKKFRKSLKNNQLIFGKHAFRKHKTPDQESRIIINASLYDVMIVGLAKYDKELILRKKEELQDKFYKLLDDNKFNRSITHGPNSPKQVRKRFNLMQNLLTEVFDD